MTVVRGKRALRLFDGTFGLIMVKKSYRYESCNSLEACEGKVEAHNGRKAIPL